MNSQILIADDDPDVLSALTMLLESEGYSIHTAATPRDALYAASYTAYALILLDLNYSLDTTSGEEGTDLLQSLKSIDNDVPIIVLTAWGSIELAVQTLKIGAADFVQKPWDNERILTTIANNIRHAAAKAENRRLNAENAVLRNHARHAQIDSLIAQSPAMKALLASLARVMDTDVSILLTGENGTGKSLLARCIHDQSLRGNGPFIPVHMGAIPESLFEAEMFGHVRGAFTDAHDERIGRFELAHSGTLFMDEIADIPLSQQTKLLTSIESGRFERVGSSKTRESDVRIVSATNSDLHNAVHHGTFRKDLYYRLNTIELCVPPLRTRTEDILPLANAFAAQLAHKHRRSKPTISPEAQAELTAYSWPGNVRELHHVMERAILFLASDQITPHDLILYKHGSPVPDTTDPQQTLVDVERRTIAARLKYYGGNAQQAAKSLGLSRSAFYRRLSKHGL